MALQKEIMSSRARLLKLATYSSVCVAILLIVIKAVVWFMSGSVSILASLVDSLMDAGASVLNIGLSYNAVSFVGAGLSLLALVLLLIQMKLAGQKALHYQQC